MKETKRGDVHNGLERYVHAVATLTDNLRKRNEVNLVVAGRWIFETIENGGMVCPFGSGHSSMVVEEAYHRAGGLIPVRPILHSSLTPHEIPAIASTLERTEGIGNLLFERANLNTKDLVIIVSNSGINAAGIEMALSCKKAGIRTIGLTSAAASTVARSRHSSGKKVQELVDLVMDTGVPAGDGLLEQNSLRYAAGSGLANLWLYNAMLAVAVDHWVAAGKELPIYRSVNHPGGDEFNRQMEQKWRHR